MLYLMCKEGVEQQQFTHAHVVSTVCGCNVMVQKIPQSTFQVIFALHFSTDAIQGYRKRWTGFETTTCIT